MAAQEREIFLQAIREKSSNDFVKLVIEKKSEKSKNNFNLKEVISALPKATLDDVWDCLQKLCTEVLLTALGGDDADFVESDTMIKPSNEDVANARQVLHAIVQVGKDTVQCEYVPLSLLQTVVVLNGVLMTFPQSAAKLKGNIAQLCELWIRLDVEGKENIGSQTILYLLQKTVKDKHDKNDLRLVWNLREYLHDLIVSGNDGQELLETLFCRCVINHDYLANTNGVNFLSYLFTLNGSVIDLLHKCVKSNIVNCTRRQAAVYGVVYLKAWRHLSDDLKTKFETDCIQDLMHVAIHIDKTNTRSASVNLQALLSVIHRENKDVKVSKLLYQLYEPILWRSLKVANGYVRCNAASLFLDCFPFENMEFNNEEYDGLINKQLQFIENLLDDECAIVRVTSVYGCFSIMYRHWALLPVTYIKIFMKKISDLSSDGSSVECRVAVFKGFTKLLENPLSHPLLKVLLPQLLNGFHDPAEKVRIAFADMLLSVKQLKSIKYWSIAPPEHLLARLAEDGARMSKKIVSLIYNSYFPTEKPDVVKLERAVLLVEANKEASRKFYQTLPKHVDLQSVVQFMLLICKALKVYLRKRMVNEDDQNMTMDGGASNVNKENVNSRQLSLPEHGDRSFSFNDPEVVCGLLDACTILWKEIYTTLYQRQNSNLLSDVHRAFTSAVPVFFVNFKDSTVNDSLVYLASLLPPKAVPMVTGHCLSRLRNMTEETSCDNPQHYATLLECVCNWGKGEDVLNLVIDWIQDGLDVKRNISDSSADAPKRQKSIGKKRKGVKFDDPLSPQPLLGIEYISWVLCHPVCKQMMLEQHRSTISIICDQLKCVIALIDKYLSSCDVSISKKLMFESLLLYMKLKLLLNSEDSCSVMNELFTYWERVVYPCLNRPESNMQTGFTDRRQLAQQITESLMTLTYNVIMVGFINEQFISNAIDFADQVLNTDVGSNFIVHYGILMQEICEFSLRNTYDIAGCITSVPELVSKCLLKFSDSMKDSSTHLPEADKLKLVVTHILRLLSTEKSLSNVYREVLAYLMTAAVAEVTVYVEKRESTDPHNKIDDYPALSSWILTVCSSKISFVRDFIDELQNCINSGTLKSETAKLAVVHISHTLFTQFGGKLNAEEMLKFFNSASDCLKNSSQNQLQIDVNEGNGGSYLDSATKIVTALVDRYSSSCE